MSTRCTCLLPHGVQTVGRLVEHEQPGLGEQGGRETEPLTHPERETAGLVVGDSGEPDLIEGVVDPRRSCVVSAKRGQVLSGGERRVQTWAVHETGDAVRSGERPSDRRTQDLQLARVGDGQAQQQAEQRCLPGTVRAHQAVNLT